ncbi:MAG: gliding motility-associated C-terminal domain-containing protein [Bacteroidota bacterium]
MIRLLAALVLAGLPFLAKAQIDAPDFLCVTNDSLQWNNVMSSCGPFIGLQIFSATDQNGPYTLLTELTSPTADFFFDNNPSGEQRFYYLQYNYDCPGEISLTSDTLDNRIPIGVQVQSVSIEGDDIRITWLPSPSPEVDRYIIFRQEPSGFQSIDTVSSFNLTYIDVGQALLDPDQVYAVTSLDACNNNSLFGAQVSTLLPLLTGGMGCEGEIVLTIDPFAQTNMLPVSALELLVSRDDCNTFELAGSFSPTATNFPFNEANDGESLCFVIEGVAANGNGRARSAVQTVDVDILQPIRPFSVFTAGYDLSGGLSYTFDWNTAPLTTSLELNFIQLSTGNNMPEQIDFTALGNGQNNGSIAPDIVGTGPHELFMTATDECMNGVLTNRISTSWLTATGENGNNQINWTAYDAEINSPVSYQLIRTDGTGNTEVVYSGADLDFIDRVDPNAEGSFSSCYQILVNYQIDGLDLTARSNTVCLEQIPGVYIPNVFSPNASQIVNREFCPLFARIPTGAYQLDVWDRWGGHVFTSTDPSFCWDGSDSGRPAGTGVYLYRLFIDLGGQQLEQVGDVTLIR